MFQEQHLAKISIVKQERIMEKTSYEHRVYESVDDKTCLGLNLKNRCKTDIMQQSLQSKEDWLG